MAAAAIENTSEKIYCIVCGSSASSFGEAIVLGKHKAEYARCGACGFIFAKNPYWLQESYRNAITSTDMGTVSRADRNSLMTKAVIEIFFHSARTFLDYGAGYGMFVRRMRDLGYNFHAHDLYCPNLFAKEFDLPDLRDKHFELTTAFEVFEHLEKPSQVTKDLLAHTGELLFTTEMLPDPAPKLSDWWYYAPEHGQHISFYTVKALKALGEQNGRFLFTNGRDLHLFSRKKINEYLFRKLITVRKSQWFALLKRRTSLLEDDWHSVRKQVLGKLGYPPGESGSY